MSLVINGKRISIEAEKSVIAVLRREIENMTLWARYVHGSKDLEEALRGAAAMAELPY